MQPTRPYEQLLQENPDLSMAFIANEYAPDQPIFESSRLINVEPIVTTLSSYLEPQNLYQTYQTRSTALASAQQQQQRMEEDDHDFISPPTVTEEAPVSSSLKGQSLATSEDQDQPPDPPDLRRRDTRRLSHSSAPSSRAAAHNLVERKYRDSLNTELERLRHAIPLIRHLDTDTPAGRPRSSKATVLAMATDYIKKLEAVIESLKDEIKMLQADSRNYNPYDYVNAEEATNAT